MKRFIALFLCLLLVVLPLAACDDSQNPEEENDKTARPNLTLKFAIVVDDRTKEEGIQEMSDQFNAYTMQKYSTAVDFYCYTADEYKAKMDEIMNGIKTDKPAKDVQDRVNPNSNIPVREEYPDARVDQFDLVVILDEAMYTEYKELGYISSIKSHLDGTYKDIKTMIHNDVMNSSLLPTAWDEDGTVTQTEAYGVPASKPIGSYKYLAVNKRVLDYYNFNTSEVKDFSFAYELWSTVMADTDTGLDYWKAEYAGKNFAPILNSEADFLYPNVQYLSQDGSESIFGLLYEPNSGITSWSPDLGILVPKNLLTDIKYTSYLKLRQQAKAADAFAKGEVSDYLLGIVEGPYNMRNSSDYYYCPLSMPYLERENVFSGMLAVSSFAVKPERAVEIILGLMTDSTMMNLLLYGVDTNYTENSEGVVSFRVSSNYALDYDYAVGNLIALAKPCSDYGQTVDYYTGARLQNLETNKEIFNEDYATYTAKINADKWAKLDEASQTYLAELAACGDYDAFVAKIAEINAELTYADGMAEDDIAAVLDWMINSGTDINGTMSMHIFEYFRYRVNKK